MPEPQPPPTSDKPEAGVRLAWYWQAGIWLALYAAWAAATRGHHPTTQIALIATGLLVAAFAAAVYIDQGLLVPRLWAAGRRAGYGVGLLAAMAATSLAAVFAIQAVYDRLWGPDPLRYGFLFNFASEFAGVALHVAGAAALVWLLRRRSSAR